MVDEQPIEDLHVKVLESLGTAIGPVTGVERIPQGEGKNVVAGSPSKTYVLDGARRRVGVLMVSNDVNPDFVCDSVEKAAHAKGMLGPKLGQVIIEPLAAGVYAGFSFAIWPLCYELSSRRGLRYIQKRLLSRHALEWLRQATEKTRAIIREEALNATIVRSLEYVADEERFVPDIRRSARVGIERIDSKRWQPYAVLEHSDLWLGNFLLPAKDLKTPQRPRFVIIDWKGANTAGYPMFDLLRLSRSFGLGDRSVRSEVLRHCETLSCQPIDAYSYLLASLGNIGLNLEHFPFERYLSMCGELYEYLNRRIGPL